MPLSEAERKALSKYLSETVKRLPDESWDDLVARRREAATRWHTDQQAPQPATAKLSGEQRTDQQSGLPKRRGRTSRAKKTVHHK